MWWDGYVWSKSICPLLASYKTVLTYLLRFRFDLERRDTQNHVMNILINVCWLKMEANHKLVVVINVAALAGNPSVLNYLVSTSWHYETGRLKTCKMASNLET